MKKEWKRMRDGRTYAVKRPIIHSGKTYTAERPTQRKDPCSEKTYAAERLSQIKKEGKLGCQSTRIRHEIVGSTLQYRAMPNTYMKTSVVVKLNNICIVMGGWRILPYLEI